MCCPARQIILKEIVEDSFCDWVITSTNSTGDMWLAEINVPMMVVLLAIVKPPPLTLDSVRVYAAMSMRLTGYEVRSNS